MDWSRCCLAALCVATLAVLAFPTPRSLFDATVPTPTRYTVLGYERAAAFGPGWARTRSGCDTREVAMGQAWQQPCAVPYTQWDVGPITDPYTGEDLYPGDVELDHLFPLSAAWDLGAYRWDAATRLQFANDPDNLIVTSSAANQAKSDMLPAEWMPPKQRSHCAYSQQLNYVARKYQLPLTTHDLRMMRRSCAGIKGLISERIL